MSERSKAARGCFGVFGSMFVVLGVLVAVSHKTPARAEAEAETSHQPQLAADENHPKGTSPNPSEPTPADVKEAEGTVAYLIGLNGYRCIKIIDTQDAGSGEYDVSCIIDHEGHRALYMVNSRTNDVAEL